MGQIESGQPVGKVRTISVCILAYQHGAFINDCVQSVLEQDIDLPTEILIGVDPSTDDTANICNELSQQNDAVQVFERTADQKIHIEGKPTGRWNLLDLLSKATGDVVAILDGDDQWASSDKLRRQVELLDKDRTLMGSYHDTNIMAATGEDTGKSWREHLPTRMSFQGTISGRSPFHLSSFLFRRQVLRHPMPTLFQRVGSFDMLLFTWCASYGDLCKADGILSLYRLHSGGLTRSGLFDRTNMHRIRIEMWSHAIDLFQGIGKEKAYEVCDRHLEEVARTGMTRGDAGKWVRTVLGSPAYFLQKPTRAFTVMKQLVKAWIRRHPQ